MVAPASGRLCACEWDRDGWFVVSDFPQLVGKGNPTKDWWCETLSASGAVLFGIDLGGLYTWMCLEPDRVGVANADLYRVALM